MFKLRDSPLIMIDSDSKWAQQKSESRPVRITIRDWLAQIIQTFPSIFRRFQHIINYLPDAFQKSDKIWQKAKSPLTHSFCQHINFPT